MLSLLTTSAMLLELAVIVTTIALVTESILRAFRRRWQSGIRARQLTRSDGQLPIVVPAISARQMKHLMNGSVNIVFLIVTDIIRTTAEHELCRDKNGCSACPIRVIPRN